jgi:hypothetical protein
MRLVAHDASHADHSRRPGGAWNHGTFRNHTEKLYTVFKCMRNQLYTIGSVSYCIHN